MIETQIRLQMDADAGLTRAEVAERLINDIEDTSRAAAVRRAARKRRLATEFGAQRGWTLASKPFGRLALIRRAVHSSARNRYEEISDDLPHEFFDHPYFYRADRRAVAIAAHLYAFGPDRTERLKKFCEANGLNWETPDFPSWWYPRQSTLVVFTAAN
jgi:hypothetical protein